MAPEKEVNNGVEWRIKVADGSSQTLVPEAKPAACSNFSLLGDLKLFIVGLAFKVCKFSQKAWDLGVDDPRKVIHCLKVGMALTVVSLFYYTRPLYEGVGGNAMWAIMTVVVVFENTVGATLCKCLNRVFGTCLAGFLAIGVHWVASQSGERFEPVIVGVSVFLLASAATFSRFIPSVKARFDYGAMIFILTFSFVSVSGYRVDRLFDLAHQRISTILIGTSLCIIVSMLVCPIWAGQELYTLITRNMDKLSDSLGACVSEYFQDGGCSLADGTDYDKECQKKLQGYKCVLSSKAAEESMANFARWEPPHGRFYFRHPWRQYIKIGASMRSCAYCIEALNGCINSENQAPECIKKHISKNSLKVSSNSASVIRELAMTIKTMKKSPNIHYLVGDLNSAVQELQTDLKSLPELFSPQSNMEAEIPENKKIEAASRTVVVTLMPLMESIPLVTQASLLIEIAARINDIVEAVEELSDLSEFSPAGNDKGKKIQPSNHFLPSRHEQKDKETMKTIQRI
ncbi:aluminum-activated malate transporter 10-like [Juglans microcarpa x Juglans regia]|uniref:aluminum-activated malate transporter 10-like n=1 Tax=Juglans microcarpa x Juglans regia TaxID=2249226 RepID=UPI001B7F2DC9|nr:aluminum-activated malate transporter 10-like [Juglans microcarpa x Juglans regia]